MEEIIDVNLITTEVDHQSKIEEIEDPIQDMVIEMPKDLQEVEWIIMIKEINGVIEIIKILEVVDIMTEMIDGEVVMIEDSTIEEEIEEVVSPMRDQESSEMDFVSFANKKVTKLTIAQMHHPEVIETIEEAEEAETEEDSDMEEEEETLMIEAHQCGKEVHQ